MADCTHPNAILKRYVGSEEQYLYCPDCGETAGGEEGQVKRALIEAALREDPGEVKEGTHNIFHEFEDSWDYWFGGGRR